MHHSLDDPRAQEALDLMVAALAVLDEMRSDLAAVRLLHAIETLQDASGAGVRG